MIPPQILAHLKERCQQKKCSILISEQNIIFNFIDEIIIYIYYKIHMTYIIHTIRLEEYLCGTYNNNVVVMFQTFIILCFLFNHELIIKYNKLIWEVTVFLMIITVITLMIV